MKLLSSLLALSLLGSVALAQETTKLTDKISCKGDDVTAFGIPSSNTLMVSLPGGVFERSLKITQVIPMYPVYSVTAQEDLRRVDGVLTTATLAIQSESLAVHGHGLSSTLTVTTEGGRRNVHHTDKYQLTCEFKH